MKRHLHSSLTVLVCFTAFAVMLTGCKKEAEEPEPEEEVEVGEFDYERYDKHRTPQCQYLVFEQQVAGPAEQLFHNAVRPANQEAYRQLVLQIRCAARDTWLALGGKVPDTVRFADTVCEDEPEPPAAA